MHSFKALMKAIGSFWLAVVLLMVPLVAMASATALESMHGTSQVQAVFYQAGWFHMLFVLLGINILAAILALFPISRRQIGMIITHSAIVVVLLGAWEPKWGVEEQLGL